MAKLQTKVDEQAQHNADLKSANTMMQSRITQLQTRFNEQTQQKAVMQSKVTQLQTKVDEKSIYVSYHRPRH